MIKILHDIRYPTHYHNPQGFGIVAYIKSRRISIINRRIYFGLLTASGLPEVAVEMEGQETCPVAICLG